MKGKILIIEDEKSLSNVMCLYLKNEGYEVYQAFDGEEGENYILENDFDLIILDVMMPKKEGWSLLRKVKTKGSTPVIITTARGEEEDRIFGLELGADDYMVKPISMRELVLRVNLRIKSNNANITLNNPIICHDNLKLTEENREVTEGGKKINLTPKEFDLLLFLLKNTNQVFKREQLLDKVWGYDFFGDTRTVDTHIKNLREKINFCNSHVKTIWGIGYMLEI